MEYIGTFCLKGQNGIGTFCLNGQNGIHRNILSERTEWNGKSRMDINGIEQMYWNGMGLFRKLVPTVQKLCPCDNSPRKLLPLGNCSHLKT